MTRAIPNHTDPLRHARFIDGRWVPELELRMGPPATPVEVELYELRWQVADLEWQLAAAKTKLATAEGFLRTAEKMLNPPEAGEGT